MSTAKGPLVLSFVTLALAAGSLVARTPQETQRVTAASDRLLATRDQLGLDADHDFSLRGSHSDQLGQTHGHFTQLYKGVRVWGSDAITHTDRNGAELPLTNGLHKNLLLNVTPSIDAGEALATAQADLAPQGAFAYPPTSELVVYPVTAEVIRRTGRLTNDLDIDATAVTRQVLRYTLAFHVHTELENAVDGIKHTDYIVDAHTGAVLKKWNTLHTTAASGTGKSQYSGVVTIDTNTTATGFELRDMTRGVGGNYVTNSNHAATTSTAVGTVYTNATNTWGDGLNYVEGSSTTAANGQTAAVDAMYGMAKSWDFYKNVFGRNGIDGAGKATYSRVHIGSGYDNAFWSDSCFCMTYGDGTSFTTLTALDVAGHEMSHGVCARTANLIYSGESGGLNEANSDIFGTLIEFYARGGSGATIGNTGGNWTIGEQLSTIPLRYMYKPSLDGASKDAWSSTLGTLDVHYSSGPMNRCFYFLSQGATTTGNTSTTLLPTGMAGVGNDKAAAIWFRALTTYLTSSSNYAAARTAAINAARDLYLAGSAEEQAVWNAFHGINVGAAWNPNADTTAPVVTSVAEAGTTGTITLSATATDAVGVVKVEFYIDNALAGTSTTSPFSATFNSALLVNGSHSLTAKAYDAAGNVGTSTATAFTTNNPTSTTIYNEVEANNSTGAANVVADTVTTIIGRVGTSTDQDFFKINVGAGRTVTVNMTGPAKDYDLYLLSSTGGTLKSSLGSTATESVTYKNTGTTAKVFYIKVLGYAGAFDATNAYTLSVSR